MFLCCSVYTCQEPTGRIFLIFSYYFQHSVSIHFYCDYIQNIMVLEKVLKTILLVPWSKSHVYYYHVVYFQFETKQGCFIVVMKSFKMVNLKEKFRSMLQTAIQVVTWLVWPSGQVFVRVTWPRKHRKPTRWPHMVVPLSFSNVGFVCL